jgi:Gnt-I system high-affinity gluconate transporter
MTFLIIFFCIVTLILLITWGKVNPFLVFIIVSIVAGLLLGIPITKITSSVTKGIGATLGDLVVVVVLGAMLGKLVAESGAAERISSVLVKTFGQKNIHWALMLTGFIVGIPLFYNVGFVLLVPLIFSISYKYKLPAVYIGLPMLAALSVTHGFLPPHPSPTALIGQFHANMGLTLLYGIPLAIPAIILAGPIFVKTIKNITSTPLETFQLEVIPEDKLPSTANSFFSSLLPILLLMITTILLLFTKVDGVVKDVITFIGDPVIVMLLAVAVATFTLGINMGKSMKAVMDIYIDATKDISMILLIISGAGIFKQVLLDSGVSEQIASTLQTWNVHPLILGWLIAAILRLCLGSATIAGLTAAGIVAPLAIHSGVNPNLMVLSVGAGSLVFSHVNDGGFWLFKEYFNLSIKDTIRSWSLMETIVALVGLGGVLVLNLFIS